MNYTVITSERSPFGRAIRMLLIANKLPFHLRVLNFVDDAQAARELAAETPINKVPILVVDHQQKIFDSRVIMNWLAKQHSFKPLTVEEENIVSSIYSCLDTSVALFLLKRDGFDIGGPGAYFARQRERLPRNLEFISPWAQSVKEWTFPAMALYSYLQWAEMRAGLLKIDEHPVFADFIKRFAHAPGVKETALT